MTIYFAVGASPPGTHKLSILRENIPPAAAAMKFIDIDAGTGQNNHSISFQAVASREAGTCYKHL